MTKEKPKKKVIVRLILEAEKEIKKELKIINKDIKDFTTRVPIPSIINIKKRDDYFKERLTGRLSTDNLRKNYEKKLILERELREIINFKYYHEEWFK